MPMMPAEFFFSARLHERRKRLNRRIMPTLAVPRDELFLRLGKHYTDAEFDELCFEFGVELDEVLTESEAAGARQLVVGGGGGGGGGEGSEAGAVSGDTVLYYIALPANRSDLLCIEGFARALNIFLGREDVPVRARRRRSPLCALAARAARRALPPPPRRTAPHRAVPRRPPPCFIYCYYCSSTWQTTR